MNLNIKGLDVSNYQGVPNFQAIKNAGYEVVIIETGDGITFTSPVLEQQYQAAKAAGLKIGFYHFFRAEDDNVAQATHFWNCIKDKQFDIYPVLDVEVTMGVSDVTASALDFLNEFKKLSGLDCIVYTYTSFAEENLDSRLSDYKCWMANYSNNLPASKIWGNNYVGWQYTESGNVAGLPNQFDLDHFSSEIFMDKNVTLNTNTNPQPVAPQVKPLWARCIHGALIKMLQNALNNQCGADLAVDGWFGDDTWHACICVRQGAQGNMTRVIQTRLTDLTYGVDGIDGIFGPKTAEAVRAFQRYHGLQVDGIVGPITWKAMMLLTA